MSDIPAFPYELLWGERSVRSVANLTRGGRREFLELAPRVPVRADVETLPLSEANERAGAAAHRARARLAGARPRPRESGRVERVAERVDVLGERPGPVLGDLYRPRADHDPVRERRAARACSGVEIPNPA
jgi:hypothetical protein